MAANPANNLKTEQTLLARIKRNPKGELMLPSSRNMRLHILLTEFNKGLDDVALLKLHSNLGEKDLAAARLYADLLARGEKVELPNAPATAKIIPMPTANAKATRPVSNLPTPTKAAAKPATQPTTPKAVVKPAAPAKPPTAPKPAEKSPVVAPPKITPTNSKEAPPIEPIGYADKWDLKNRTTNFGVEIMRLYETLPKTTEAQHVGDQVLRSGTSVGAHYREAMYARTQAAFVSKIDVGLQELEETKHWFQLLVEGGIVAAPRLAALRREAEELTAILVATVNLAKIRWGK